MNSPALSVSRSLLSRAVMYAGIVAALALPALGGDWPMYRHDTKRSAITDETLELPLHAAWAYHPAQAPSHAWPEPVKLLNRLDFDYAPQLVVADGIVVWGSSADDTVRALDATTGALRWQYTTGGPIRLAPQIYEGKVYFGSDDGWAYCLDAATGKPVWSVHVAPRDDMLLGNERLISRWPCRSGVMVADGVAYTTAGMWPADGIFVYALDAATGKTIWVNDTSGHINDVRTLHTNQDFAPYGVSPQGSLLLSDGQLLVPTGKGMPAVFDATTGKLRHYQMGPTYNQSGGSWVVVDGENFYTMPMIRYFKISDGERIGAINTRSVEPIAVRAPGKAFHQYDGGKISAVIRDGKAEMRRAFDLVRAGEVLVEGLDDEVTVVQADQETPLWRAPVDGEARCVVVASGRVYVSTTSGRIYSFASGAATQTVVHESSADLPVRTYRAPTEATPATLLGAGKTLGFEPSYTERGYAVVFGDDDATLQATIDAILTHTRYYLIAVVPDEATARAMRERLIATTRVYGTQLYVVAANADRFQLTDFMANLVISTDATPMVPPAEMYRILRPCGGVLHIDAASAEVIARMSAASEKMGDEVAATADAITIRRGTLPGARDWDQPGGVDERVKWPLRLLWFGGPGPADVLDRKQGNVIGPFAHGRYFIRNETNLTGVDAYNGSILWTRPIPQYLTEILLADSIHKASDMVGRGGRDFDLRFTADDKYLYVTEKGHVGKDAWSGYLLDLRTGRQLQVYGPWNPPAAQASLSAPRSWEIPVDEGHSGKVTAALDGGDVVFTLTTLDPAVTPEDRWELFLDFRPLDQRYGLYGDGTISLNIYPPTADAAARWTPSSNATADMPVMLEGSHDKTGATVRVRLPKAMVTTLTGGAPLTSFDFGARLSNFDRDGVPDVTRAYLFSTFAGDAINDGWARLYVSDDLATLATPPTVLAGTYEEMPTLPHYPRTMRDAPQDSMLRAQRRHPMTGELGPKFYQTGSFGCGGETFSVSLAITRSTGIGIYDFTDDSGMRVFDGVKPSCRGSVVAALGLVLSSEGRGGCECTTNFQASLALAPTDRRSNEDWALYYDLAPFGLLRQVVVNLGAPGDRRDDAGQLWFGYPRVQNPVGRAMLPPGVMAYGMGNQDVSAVLQVPLAVEVMDGGGDERVNADRVTIAGTERPWIYASHYRGITRATVELGQSEFLASAGAPVTPTLDGRMEANEWPPEPVAVLDKAKTRIYVAHDDTNLYVAGVYPAIVDRLGKSIPWRVRKDAEPDTYIDRDESCELYISDAKQEIVLRLTVLVGGTHYDTRWEAGGDAAPDLAWNGNWQSAVVATDEAFTTEMTVPWATIKAAGIDPATVRINLMSCGPYRWSDALRVIGDRERCDRFIPLALTAAPASPTRSFTVRLHFAETDPAVTPGQRVYTVKMQGKVILEDLDIAAEVGTNTALEKTFTNVQAGDKLELEFIPKDPAAGAALGPLLSGLEIIDETFTATATVAP